MSGRRALLLIAVALCGLCARLGPPRTERPATSHPALPNADVPIVAVRGRPLAAYEEPLPAGARVRIGSTRYRLPTSLRESNWVAARDYLVTSTHGGLVPIETTTGRYVRASPEGTSSLWGPALPSGLAASPNGRRLATWNPQYFPTERTSSVQVWDVGGDPTQPVRPGAPLQFPPDEIPAPRQVHFSADGRELVLSGENEVVVFDTATGCALRRFPSRTRVLASAAGSYMTSSEENPASGYGGFDGLVLMPSYRFRPPTAANAPDYEWPIFEDNRVLRRPGRTKAGEPFAAFDLIVRDTASGQVVASISAPRDPEATIEHFALSPDGRFVAAEFEGDILVWEVATSRRIARVSCSPRRHKTVNYIRGAHFSADSRRLIVSERHDRERYIDLASGREVPADPEADAIRRARELGAAVVPEVDEYGSVRCRDGSTGRVVAPPPGYAGVIIDVSPDGRLTAVGDATGRLDVWRPDGSLAALLGPLGRGVSAVAFTPDGRRLAVCDRGRTIRIWSVGAWIERDRIEVPADDDRLCPDHLTFRPDGRRLLISRGEVMALWDLAARRWVWDQSGGFETWRRSRQAPLFAPDGDTLLTPGFVRLVAESGEYYGAIEHLSPVEYLGLRGRTAFALSPDGTRLATFGEDSGLEVRDFATGKVVQTFPESPHIPARDGTLRFSPDGRRLVTCDDAWHAHVWEVASGQLAFTLTYPDGAVHDVRFGADGRSLISSNHREVIVWDLAPEPGAAAEAWADLAQEAPRAEQARRKLLSDPVPAVELLKRRLRPAVPVDTAAVAGLIARLDATDYRGRERAAAGLVAVGRRVVPLLREATANSEEGKARLAALVRELSAGPTAYELREVRAVEVLEQIASSAARDLLKELAAGDPGSVLTEDARAACRRLSPRYAVPN